MVLAARVIAVLMTAVVTVIAVVSSLTFIVVFVLTVVQQFKPKGMEIFTIASPPVKDILGIDPIFALIGILLSCACAWGYIWLTRDGVVVSEN